MSDNTKKKSAALLKAEKMLSEEEIPFLEPMIEEYQHAALVHHGHTMVSPLVIAELIKMDWRSE